MNSAHHTLFNPKRPKGLSAEEKAFADTQRANRASWAAIARMLDRSEHDVRCACDPDYGDQG